MLGIAFRKLLDAVLLSCALFVPAHAADEPKQELLVFAAASLTNVLDEIGKAYTQQTQQSVKFSYAASSALALYEAQQDEAVCAACEPEPIPK